MARPFSFLDYEKRFLTDIPDSSFVSRIPAKRMILEARCQWLTPVILATQKAEIRRIVIQSQTGQIVCETLS
jgi:hypothetical protein